jgi:hypothetical protein
MNFKPRHFIFSTCLFLISTFSFAQSVFIANDFVACAVGLKDSSGKWIVEPIYQDIDRWPDGYFQVLYGSKEGVINSEGKIVIPPIYDNVSYDYVYIDSVARYFFTVTEKNVSGLLNDKNQFIIPISCRKIKVNSDQTIIAEKTRKRYSIYDLQGNEKVIPKKQGTEPLSLGGRMFKVSRNSFGLTLIERYFPESKKEWRRYRYRLTPRKKYGVMNDSLRMIIPKKFSDVYYGPGKYELITVEKKKKTGFYNKAGKQIWAPVYTVGYSFRRKNYVFGDSKTLINAFGFTAAMHDKKYGIISATGDTILPFIYSSISMPYGGNNSTSWNVELNGKDGIYNPSERKWIIEPIYESLYTMTVFSFADDTTTNASRNTGLYRPYYYDYNNPSGIKLLIAYKDGKYGIITSVGQEILPFVYDDYERKFSGYCFRKDSSYYMASIPQYMVEKTPHTYLSANNIVSKAPANQKFKKITAENGVTLFINLDLADDSVQLALYQLNSNAYEMNPNTYDHLLHTTALVVTPLYPTKNMAGIGNVYSYHTTNLNYTPGNATEDFVIRQKKNYFNLYEVNVVAEDNFHSYYSVGSVSGLYRDDGFTVIRPYSYDYYSYREKINGVAYFSINCGKNKTGLIDGNGKLLLDTAWGQVGSVSGKYIWVKKKYHSWFWSRNTYKWNILDTTTHELLLDRKLRSATGMVFGTNAVIIDRPEGLKLYNMDQRKYILDGNVRELLKLDPAGNYFAVRTCYGNIGIIDGNGKWLTDTVWKMMINANNTVRNSSTLYRSRYYREKSTYNYCVLSNDTGLLIFDGYKGIVTNDAQTAHAMMAMASKSFTQDTISGLDKFCDDCPSYSYVDTLRNNEQLAAWQEYILFDSLFGPTFMPDTLHYWSNYGCSDCRKRNPHQYFQYAWSGNYDQETLHHYIGFKNESCISVSRTNLGGYSYNGFHPKDLFFTVMLFNDGPHAMLLDSLFTGTEWKNFISTETNLYFESHPNIEGNCHNPFMLPVVMKDRFVLTKDGIELYPPNYKENDHQLFVPISWEKLKPYLREDVAQKLQLK